MSIRPMKWHIFNDEHCPLCWDEEAIEFDTEEAAKMFLVAFAEGCYDTPIEEYCYELGIEIKECIFYYDGGYINLTGKIPAMGDDWEIVLKDVIKDD